jgi:hypothetical protein
MSDSDTHEHDEPGHLKAAHKKLRAKVRALHWFLYRKFPRFIDSPEFKPSLRSHRERDPSENAETSPDPDDGSNLQCIWALEFYTPSEIDGLRNGLSKLGWTEGDSLRPDRNLLSWLEESRSGRWASGYMHVGDLLPPGRTKFPFSDRTAPLPDNVDYASAYLFNISSSITCLVVCFVLEEAYGKVFDDALRKSYETKFERLDRGWTIVSPRSHKERQVQDIRGSLRRAVTSWFRIHLPGVFSAKYHEGSVPTCEFTVLQGAPFSSQAQSKATYLQLLEIDGSFDAWQTPEFPGLRFIWPLKSARADGFHAALVAEQMSLDVTDMRHYRGRDRGAYLAKITNELGFQTLLTRWGCLALLGDLEARLNRIRDASLHCPSADTPRVLLQKLREAVADSLDIAAITPELIEITKGNGLFKHETGHFEHVQHREKDGSSYKLIDHLASNIRRRAERLQAADKSVKELLLQQGNLVSADENIRLQSTMSTMTIVMLILTVVTVVLTCVTVYQAFSSTQKTSITQIEAI